MKNVRRVWRLLFLFWTGAIVAIAYNFLAGSVLYLSFSILLSFLVALACSFTVPLWWLNIPPSWVKKREDVLEAAYNAVYQIAIAVLTELIREEYNKAVRESLEKSISQESCDSGLKQTSVLG